MISKKLMQTKKKKMIYILIIFLLFLLFSFYSNTKKRVIYKVTLSNGVKADVQIDVIRGRFIRIVAHYGFTIGSKTPTYIIHCYNNGKNIEWKGIYKPLIINSIDNDFYIVVLDLETDIDKIRLRYFKMNHDKWNEISHNNFPRNIAIQNLLLSHNAGMKSDRSIIDEYKIVQELNPYDDMFQKSRTAKIWQHIEYGIDYYESHDRVDSEVLKDFKEKYFK